MFYKNKIGKFGQKIAIYYLKNKAHKIIAENIYFRGGEIDILTEKDGILRFVEVKTRTNLEFGYPEESISKRKLEHLKRAIDAYILENNIEKQYNLEFVGVLLSGKNARIKHIIID
ncbi:MAG: YraN family protein [Patescibacteria group bacterium]|nr:YraN family protein [Patescibacteria group bacterium]MDD4304137.1 YraN family protein [Patescibacteria group bacterium]MDD4695168.1 YraN family protein [Patescibacteria group bacterium]